MGLARMAPGLSADSPGLLHPMGMRSQTIKRTHVCLARKIAQPIGDAVILSSNQSLRQRWLPVACFVLMSGLCLSQPAHADERDAKNAIMRAEAKIELVLRETPNATQDPSFAVAREKIIQARTALDRNKDQQAEWFANEAELLTELTAGAAQLAGLERTRLEVRRSVDILESELRNN